MQTMRANKETVAALSKKIEQLNKIVMNVVQKVERRAASRGMDKTELWEDVQATEGWKDRVNQLQEWVTWPRVLLVRRLTFAVSVLWRRELQKLLEKAQARAEGSYLKRLFRSTRDEETLKAIATDLTDMLQRYQVFATDVHL